MESIYRLKEVLAEKGISGKDLAEKVSVTPNTISNIIAGRQQPKPELLLAIAETLDVSIREILVDTKPNTKQSTKIYSKSEDGSFTEIGELY